MVVFQGEFDHSVDEKGRVIIPAQFRASLGLRFYLTKGVDYCVFLYTEAAYQDLSAALDKQRQLDRHSMMLQRFFTSTESSVDGQGRVAIPAKLREYAKIGEGDTAVIVGTGSRIEIWSKAVWDQYNAGLTAEMIADAARELGIA